MKNNHLKRPAGSTQRDNSTQACRTPARTALQIQLVVKRTFLCVCCSAGYLAMFTLSMHAQRAHAQIVQLPSMHSFSSSSSVLVPDGGSASLGGSGYARQGSTSSGFGPLPSGASAGSVGGSSISASVQIIDLEALDQAILASATPRASLPAQASPAAASAPAAPLSVDESHDAGQQAQVSIRSADRTRQLSANGTERVGADPGKWQRVLSGGGTPTAVNASMVESNVRYYVELGEQAERSGSAQAARVYYRLARQAMTPELVAQYENALRVRAAEATARKQDEEQARRKF